MSVRDSCRAVPAPFLIATLAVAAGGAPEAAAFERRDIVCELEELTRLISLRVDPDAGYVCDVLYEKPDEGDTREVVWSARNDVDYCTPRFDTLVEGLASRGWTCGYAEAPIEAPAIGAARDERADDDEASSEGVIGKFRDWCVADVASGESVAGAGSVKSYCNCVADGMNADGLSEEDAQVIFHGLSSVSAGEGEASGGDKSLNMLLVNYEAVVASCR